MSYTINLTNGTTLATVPDGTVNTTSCSLTLIGRNYSGYGTYFNDNLVHLLENASDSTPPSTPLTGQLWWDTAGNLKVYTGAAFKTISSVTSSSTQPTGAVTGNFWWDTDSEQLYTYTGSNWVLVGPANAANLGNTGITFGNIVDNVSGEHIAANIKIGEYIVAIVSSDATYTPQTSIPGFSTIKPGFNLVGTGNIADVSYWGAAENATKLANVAAANYARTDQAVVFSNNITSNIGVTIGTSGKRVANLNGLNARITNHITTGNLTLRANVVGTIVNSLNIDGTTGNVEIVGNLNTSSNLRITNNLSASSAAFTNTLSADTLSITDTVTVNDLLTADKLATTTTTTLSGNIILDGAQVLTNGGVVSLNVLTSYFSTTAAWTATLLAGTAGQIKVLAMLADGGNMVITVTNPAWGGAGTLTFADVGDACTLQYIGSKWFVIGNNGVTIA
jgi:hypothetical protein